MKMDHEAAVKAARLEAAGAKEKLTAVERKAAQAKTGLRTAKAAYKQAKKTLKLARKEAKAARKAAADLRDAAADAQRELLKAEKKAAEARRGRSKRPPRSKQGTQSTTFSPVKAKRAAPISTVTGPSSTPAPASTE